MIRAVELLEQTNQELLVELVRALGIHDVDVKDALTRRRPLEMFGVVRNVLTEMLVRLPRRVEATSDRCSLEWVDRSVVRPQAVVEIAADVQPAKDLHVAARPDRMS